MTYNFAEVAADAHDDTWSYDSSLKCGFSSLRNFDYSCYSVAYMTEEDGDVTTDEWKTDCMDYNEEYVIDWNSDIDSVMASISESLGDVIVKFRLDGMKSGVICVDYNTREVTIDEASDYYGVDFYTYKNGEEVEEEDS